MAIGTTWGATPEERAAHLPCDDLRPDASVVADRAVTVRADAATLFRWLCQLRVAPYSYDLIDNLGRRSPRKLTPGLERLDVGQRFMTIFRLDSFEPDEQLTITSRRGAVTYAIRPAAEGVRLVARLRFDVPWPLGTLLTVGDLVMMRKQLLTLRELAERDAAAAAAPHG